VRHLTKPVDPDELLEAIAELAQQAAAEEASAKPRPRRA